MGKTFDPAKPEDYVKSFAIKRVVRRPDLPHGRRDIAGAENAQLRVALGRCCSACSSVVWHLATRGSGPVAQMDPEYAKLMGATATQGKSAMPGPLDVGAKLWEHLQRPFYDNGPNDKGVGIQLAYSIARVADRLSARRRWSRSRSAS